MRCFSLLFTTLLSLSGYSGEILSTHSQFQTNYYLCVITTEMLVEIPRWKPSQADNPRLAAATALKKAEGFIRGIEPQRV